MTNTAALKQNILELADQCVKCGLCSSQCPTYLLNQDENESPRGRIALAQALATDSLSAQGKLTTHIQNCLQCRRCEAVCPSEVHYGELINLTNTLINLKSKKRSLGLTKWISLLTHRQWVIIANFYAFAQITGLIQLLKINSLGKSLLRLMPQRSSKNRRHTKLQINHKKEVSIFTGCLSHLADKQSMDATIHLLEHCGYKVKIPQKQVCCGAIADREGDSETSQECQLNNQIAFSDKNDSPIIFFTTGCGAKLLEYKEQLPSELAFSKRTFSVSDFLNRSTRFAKIRFSPLKKKVLIFSPCSELNILKQAHATRELLLRIPDIEILTLAKSTGCCGASGTHLLTHQQQAQLVREPILAQIMQLSPDLIVGPNYPCNLHIHSGLKQKNMDIPMIHPIQLLLNQIIATE